MRAARVVTLDGPSAVEVGDVDEPQPSGGQVVIDVEYAGLTYPDVLLTRGQYQIKPPPPFIPGSEVAGVVRSAPDGSGFSEGDRVAAFPASADSRRPFPRTPAWCSRCPTPWAWTPLPGCR